MDVVVPNIRLRCHSSINTIDTIKPNDVVVIPSVFTMDTTTMVKNEIDNANMLSNDKLIVPWHKDSHLIANEKYNNGQWKRQCPTYLSIVDVIALSFNLVDTSSRIEIFKGGNKPFHNHFPISNVTAVVSFGATREIAFKRKSKDGCIVSTICDNGSVYAFAHDVKHDWQHGVLPCDDGMAIVVWGRQEGVPPPPPPPFYRKKFSCTN